MGKEEPVRLAEPINSDQILEQFDKNIKFTKKFEHPNWIIYTSQRRKELETAIKVQEKILPLQKKISELESQNNKLQVMLSKTLSFTQAVRDSKVGKLFFGKKAEEVLGEQDKNAKQLSDGR